MRYDLSPAVVRMIRCVLVIAHVRTHGAKLTLAEIAGLMSLTLGVSMLYLTSFSLTVARN